MSGYTPGPWQLCHHLSSVDADASCPCGYRGVIFGPGPEGRAICQPGHDAAPQGQEGTEPPRYPREIEIANARLIAASPTMYEAARDFIHALDRGYLDCKDDSAFIDALRAAVFKAKARS